MEQQQVRHLWSNVGTWHLNLWMYTLTELWAWPLQAKQLTHRDDSPWDTTDLRPSHADKRKALQAECPVLPRWPFGKETIVFCRMDGGHADACIALQNSGFGKTVKNP